MSERRKSDLLMRATMGEVGVGSVADLGHSAAAPAGRFRVFLANYETPKLWRISTQVADFILAGQPKGKQRARGLGRT